MKHRHLILTALVGLTCALAPAQQLFTTNDPLAAARMLEPRNLNYWPEGSDFVCIDGQNRFTRALYGAGSAFRLETSDGLEFGLYMPYMGGNVTMTLPHEQIEARYRPGRRIYRITLRPDCRADASRPATVTVTALALYAEDGAVWRIEADNVRRGTELGLRYGAASNSSFSRNGDMGVDRKDCFDFAPDKCRDNIYTFIYDKKRGDRFTLDYGRLSKRGQRWLTGFCDPVFATALHEETLPEGDTARWLTARMDLALKKGRAAYFALVAGRDKELDLARAFADAEREADRVASTLVIETPDPVFNTVGGALSMAADGIWSGEDSVWLHGAIGWRNPLPGWRAAYTGDVLGWHDRARTHFDNYAASQLIDVPVNPAIPPQDTALRLARATEKIGAPLFTTGYIGRYPNNPTKINHYDMNLVYIDELLWHFQWTGDWDYMRRLWPTLERHLEWEHRNFDPDDDGLYDAYCCIWASDALYYSGGAVTHSSAYNYRACRLAADIAARLGYADKAELYDRRARQILDAINTHLWIPEPEVATPIECVWTPASGIWAEYADTRGLRRQHREPALWTVYHAIDSDIADDGQKAGAARYVSHRIPHFPIAVRTDSVGSRPADAMPDAARALIDDIAGGGYATVSTTSWQPYAWSINNVALAEVAHTALALWQAGDAPQAYTLLKSALLDGMYLGGSPGNVGQISHYDAARSECYRDFGDPVGITTRTVVQGLFGVRPDRIHDRIVIAPGVPTDWKTCRIRTADFDLRLTTGDDGTRRWTVTLSDTFRADTLVLAGETIATPTAGTYTAVDRRPVPRSVALSRSGLGFGSQSDYVPAAVPSVEEKARELTAQFDFTPVTMPYNLGVADIFRQRYLSPRYEYPTLAIPTQGIGEWCHPLDSFCVDDSGWRTLAQQALEAMRADGRDGMPVVRTDLGVPFFAPAEGDNVYFTSLWDNYPDRVSVPLTGRADCAFLLLTGTTNAMQSRIDNGAVRVRYADGTEVLLPLNNPVNWWPIEQDLMTGLPSFYLTAPDETVPASPFRMSLRTGRCYYPQSVRLNQPTDGGAATLLTLALDPKKELGSVEVETYSNDVIIGLMGVTLGRKK